MGRFWDYYDECLDVESFAGVEAYFHRRYEAYADYTLDEDIDAERHKKENKKAENRKSPTCVNDQDSYDAIEEQARKEARDMERRIERRAMLGSYIPGGMDMDF